MDQRIERKLDIRMLYKMDQRIERKLDIRML